MVDLLEDLVEQMKANGDIVNAEKIQVLANKGHNIARLEDYLVEKFAHCMGNRTCIEELRGVKETIPGFISDPENYMTDSPDLTYKDKVKMLLNAESDYYVMLDKVEEKIEEDWQVYPYQIDVTFYSELVSVKNDETIDENVKNFVDGLADEIMSISQNLKPIHDVIWFNEDKFYDALSSDISSTEIGSLTDHDSALICKAGMYEDENNICTK